MKPERIQFAPWFNEWFTPAPYIRKAFACDSLDDALHYVGHVHRVARFYPDSQVKTTIDEDFFVDVRILPVKGSAVSSAQHALGQRLDASLTYLQFGPQEEVPMVNAEEVEDLV